MTPEKAHDAGARVERPAGPAPAADPLPTSHGGSEESTSAEEAPQENGSAPRGWWSRRRRGWAGDPAMHAYRRLVSALRVELEDVTDRGVAVAFTSPRRNRESTHAAREFAEFLALDSGSAVLLIDACLLRPALTKSLDPDRGSGLVEALADRSSTALRRVVPLSEGGADFLPAGSVDELGAMRREDVERVVRAATERYAYVVLACPPALEDSTMLAFPAAVDSTLLLGVEGKTRVEDLDGAQQVLGSCGAQRVGLVATRPLRRRWFGLLGPR